MKISISFVSCMKTKQLLDLCKHMWFMFDLHPRLINRCVGVIRVSSHAHDTLITALERRSISLTQLRAAPSLFNIFLTRHRHRLQHIQRDFKLYEIISHLLSPRLSDDPSLLFFHRRRDWCCSGSQRGQRDQQTGRKFCPVSPEHLSLKRVCFQAYAEIRVCCISNQMVLSNAIRSNNSTFPMVSGNY